MTVSPVTAADLMKALRTRYSPPEYELAEEVGDATGFGTRRHLDAVACGMWPSKGYHLLGFELKVSRADFLRELDQPEKRAAFESMLHEFWFVLPSKLVQKHEIPEGCGLMELRGDRLVRVVRATHRRENEPDGILWAAIARAMAKPAHRLRAQRRNFAKLAGRSVSIDDLTRLAEKLHGRLSRERHADRSEARERRSLEFAELRARWSDAIQELVRLAADDGVQGLRAWGALGSPEASQQITEWLRSKRSLRLLDTRLRELFTVLDRDVRPLLVPEPVEDPA